MLSNPIDAYLQAARQQNDNRQQMYQNISGMGQGIGAGFTGVAHAMEEDRKKKLVMQLAQAMQTQGAPQQGPQLPGMPTTSGEPQPPPTSGMGAPGQDNSRQMMGLMSQIDPSSMITHYLGQMDPYKKALTDLYGAEAEKARRPPKPTPEWGAVGGQVSKNNRTVLFDKITGKTIEGDVPVTATQAMPGGMANVRANQFMMQDLPSRSAPTTAAGAAYQVLVGSRQGIALTATPGGYQRRGLATGDAARSVLRATPTDEAMQNANFSDTLVNRVNKMRQRLTSDPAAIDEPKMRKEMYDVFKELRESSRPFIENQLSQMESIWRDSLPPNWEQMKKTELGDTMSEIPFQETLLDVGKIKSGNAGWGIQKVQ